MFVGLIPVCVKINNAISGLKLFVFLPCCGVGGHGCVHFNLLYNSLSDMFNGKCGFVALQKVISNYFCASCLHRPIYHRGMVTEVL